MDPFFFSFRKKGKGRGGKRDRKPKKVVFTCKIKMCHEEFENQDALIQHKINAHRRIQCTHCPDLKLVVDLNKHLRNTHGISQNSMCEHCGQVYTNTRSLQVRQRFITIMKQNILGKKFGIPALLGIPLSLFQIFNQMPTKTRSEFPV